MAVKNHAKEVDFRRLPILSHDVICIVGFDGAFREINPAGEKTLGFTTKELADKPYLEFVHLGDQSTTATQIQHQTPFVLSLRFLHGLRTIAPLSVGLSEMSPR